MYRANKQVIFVMLALLISFPAFAAGGDEGAEVKESGFGSKLKEFTRSFKANDGYLDFGLRTGYIYGYTSFDFNHQVSEIEYPFRSYLGGGKLNLGYKDLSINSEFWGSLLDDPSAGWHVEDKDWEKGQLESDTKSGSTMNAVIWDLNLRYNFFKHSFAKNKGEGEGVKTDNIKIGALVGYRYERFGFNGFGLYQTGTGQGMEPESSSVFEYTVKYRLPYYGLAADIGTDKFGLLMTAKYAFSPFARDEDKHVLWSRTNYAVYSKHPNVFMANVTAFWKFRKNWEANFGVDAALIRISGRSWCDNHDTRWDVDQNLDARQFIYWLGLGYKF